MEALAAGVPVVMRDLPVLREVFADTVTFASTARELAAAVIEADRAPSTRRLAAGQALARRHTWAAAAQAHEQLYARLLAARAGIGDAVDVPARSAAG